VKEELAFGSISVLKRELDVISDERGFEVCLATFVEVSARLTQAHCSTYVVDDAKLMTKLDSSILKGSNRH